jgi:hypothetical protein
MGRDDFSYAGYYDLDRKFHIYGISKKQNGINPLNRSFWNYLWTKHRVGMERGFIIPYQSNVCLLSYNPTKPIGYKLMFCISNTEADKIM